MRANSRAMSGLGRFVVGSREKSRSSENLGSRYSTRKAVPPTNARSAVLPAS